MRFFRHRPKAETITTVTPDQQQRFVTLDGRRFDTSAPYALPTDLTEDNRLDFQHYMIRYIMRGNYRAPLHAPKDILDVGTSTALWAYEMAKQFPDANVVGLDKDQPIRDSAQQMLTPENYVYVEHNIFASGQPALPFADQSFDLIHQRLLIAAIPEQLWQNAVQV